MTTLNETIKTALSTAIEKCSYPEQFSTHIADAIVAKFLLIDRADLPGTSITKHNGHDMIEVAGERDSWWDPKTASATTARRSALQFLAAAEALENYKPEPAPVTLNLSGHSKVYRDGEQVFSTDAPCVYKFTPIHGTSITVTTNY